MKKYTILLAFLLLPVSIFAQESSTIKRKETISISIPCYDTKELFASLRTMYMEIPIVYGKTDDIAQSTFSMWANNKEKTFTLVATIDDLSCVVGSGRELKPVPKDIASRK